MLRPDEKLYPGASKQVEALVSQHGEVDHYRRDLWSVRWCVQDQVRRWARDPDSDGSLMVDSPIGRRCPAGAREQ